MAPPPLSLPLISFSSINLGVLVCIECSGVHRSLGVYVSQVHIRTLSLSLSLSPSLSLPLSLPLLSFSSCSLTFPLILILAHFPLPLSSFFFLALPPPTFSYPLSNDSCISSAQVRSLTLDTLKPEWLEKLKEFGNKNSNGIYEKNLPEDFDRGIYCVCTYYM